MTRGNEFKAFLNKNKLPAKYFGYCEKIESAFGGIDMDEIILSHQNISKVRDKLKTISKSDNSVNQYISGFNTYLKFAFSAATSIQTTCVNTDFYHVARAKEVPLTSEVEFICRTLENEYANIIQFAEDLLVQGSFNSIPIIVSDDMPMQDSPQGEEKVLGRFFGSTKPYIEIYHRNYEPYDAAEIRQCLAHEYLHYLHFVFAGKEYANSKKESKELKEGLADFFGVLYSIHRKGKDDLKAAKKRYDQWKKNFGTYWPYANALYFFRVSGNEMNYSPNYDNCVKHGCIGKFVQVFFSTQHPDNAHNSMLCC